MQVLDDIWASVKGNAKTRINDPIIGAFVISWGLCNWDRLALLFLGAGKLDTRINMFTQEVSFINEPSLIWTNHALLLLPLLITAFYIFVLPSVAHAIEKKLKPTQINRHDHTVDLDLNKAIKQKELNKARLRTNPDNEFLAQEVKIDIEREKREAEVKKAEAEIKKSEAETLRNQEVESKAKVTSAELELKKRESEAKTAKLVLENHERQTKVEKNELAISTAKKNSTLASHRFPASYFFLELLSDNLKEEDVIMSLDGLTSCISTIFGYESFSNLLNDKEFTNENLEQVKYLLLDADKVTAGLSKVLINEGIEGFDSKWLIGVLEDIFETYSYQLVYPDTLADIIQDEVNNFDLSSLNGMDEIPTAIENINELIIDEYHYDDRLNEFFVSFSGSASGSHVSYSSVSGPDIELSIEARCYSIIGGAGLGEPEINGGATVKEPEENY
ncbi:MAG TPA: hypothetical protein DEO86_22865 [Colwellia sp.]|nr:hypothetical protein [Colwellia sp.]|tara:strand:- start:2712 stop:4052 length:1341 start_codon:yes stop_codon:yes gene_type:complete